MTLNVDHEKNSFHVYDTVPPIQGSLLSLVVASCTLGVVTYQLHFFLQQFPPPLPILLGVYGLDCVGAAKRIQLLSCQTYWLKKHLAHEWC